MERRKDLDFAKGVGIVLMILGHSFSAGNGDIIIQWLYSFHMPLFFIVSGIIKHFQEEKAFSLIIKNRFSRLLIPYFVWSCIAAFVLSLLGNRPWSFLLDCIKSIFTLSGISAMWFLPCMFISEMLAWILIQIHKTRKWCAVLLTTILLILSTTIVTDSLPLVVLLRSFIGTTFVYLGFLLGHIYTKKATMPVWVLLAGIHIGICYLNGRISIASRQYGNVLLFYLGGLVGTWLFIRLYDAFRCSALRKVAYGISWLGKNSLIIVCTSLYPIEFIRLLDYKFMGNILPMLGVFEGIIICLFSITIEIGIICFCNKFLYILFGHKTPINNDGIIIKGIRENT